jgi:hypothetical protein
VYLVGPVPARNDEIVEAKVHVVAQAVSEHGTTADACEQLRHGAGGSSEPLAHSAGKNDRLHLPNPLS